MDGLIPPIPGNLMVASHERMPRGERRARGRLGGPEMTSRSCVERERKRFVARGRGGSPAFAVVVLFLARGAVYKVGTLVEAKLHQRA